MARGDAAAMQRQRLRVKRRYYRTVDSIKEARDLVAKLTQQHRLALARQQQLARQQPDREPALQLYVQASALADQLVQEKMALMKLLGEREMLQHRILALVGEDGNDTQPREWAVTFTALTVEDCSQIASRAFASIQQFLQSHEVVSTNGSMLGWRDRRQIKGALVHMSIQKVLVGYGPFDLSLRSWTFLRSAAEFSKLYSGSMNARMQLMQVVNDSNVVHYGQFTHSELNVKFHCLFLVSWIQIQDGYATLLQSVDRSRLNREQTALANGVDDATEQWMEVNQWIICQECPDQDDRTNVVYGGTLESTTEAGSRQWMVEMFLIALRWENKVIGPRSLLPS